MEPDGGPSGLLGELRSLRKGPAFLRRDLAVRVGPNVRSAFDIEQTDPPAVIRQKVAHHIATLLPDDTDHLRTALLTALALLPGADHRLLGARERWLADRLRWDLRTVRRRVRDADQRLVDALAAAGGAGTTSRDEPSHDDGFIVRRLVATMRLDRPVPRLREQRAILVTAARLAHIRIRLTVPRPDGVAKSVVEARSESGGRLIDVLRQSPEHFVFTIEPPRVLAAGEEHTLALSYTLPPRQPMRPHYVLQPLTSCEWFELVVHFGRTSPPSVAWLIDGVAPRVLDELLTGVPLASDAARPDHRGVLRHHFVAPRTGMAYGVRWH